MNNAFLITKKFSFSRPFIPRHISMLLNCKQSCKDIYNMINTHEVEYKYKVKWNKDLPLNIDNSTLKNVFRQILYDVQDNCLIWLQYRLIHRILGTKDILCKMSIVDSNTCRICKCEPETLMYLFVYCTHIVNLWKSMELRMHSSTNKRITFSQKEIIISKIKDNNYYSINMITVVTKSYIFSSAAHESKPNINCLKNKFQKQYEDQHHINIEVNKADKFTHQWRPYRSLFCP